VSGAIAMPGETIGPFARWARTLIEWGYAPLPEIPGTKKPGAFDHRGQWAGLTGWPKCYDNGRPSKETLEIWGRNGTGLGVLCGYNGLAVGDIDTENTEIRQVIEAVIRQAIEEVRSAANPDVLTAPFEPISPVSKRGRKGESFFFYAPGLASQSWKINDEMIFELLAAGRKCTIPPTIHEDTGQPYIWTSESDVTDLRPEELPRLPDDIADRISAALKPFGYKPELRLVEGGSSRQAGIAGDADSPFRQLEDLAMANLHLWVPKLPLYKCRPIARGGYEAVATWRKSSQGRPDRRRDLNLKIHPEGIRDFGDGTKYGPIALVKAACECDATTAFNFLADQLGYGECDVSALIEMAGPSIEQEEQEPVTTRPEPKPAETNAEPPLLKYTYNVPGLVGEIIEWTIDTARRPNRIVALGTAISVTGTLIGRRVAGPTRSATHLYTMAIGDTGHGKQHGINTATKLMHAAGAGSHLGAGEYFSLSGVYSMLWESPLTLCLQDEFGKFIQGVNDSKSNSWEKSVSRVLRTLWGTSFGMLPGVQWAKEKKKAIWSPALSIYGFSTPDEFNAALQGDSITNGFVNRLLMLELGERHPEIDPAIDLDVVPPSFADKLRALYMWSGPESLVRIDDPAIPELKPDVLPWADSQAHACYKDFSRFIDAEGDKKPDIKDFISRCAETAIRLATIRAAGRWGHGATVDTSDVDWARDIVWTATQSLATGIQDYEPETDRKKSIDRIARWMRRKHPELKRAITWTEIRRYEGGNVKTPELRDRIEHMVAVGTIKKEGGGYVPVGK
jgi:hypothetical protein